MAKTPALVIKNIPINEIDANPWNPNKQNERQYQAEIESIAENGFLAPILVRANGDRHEIIDGEHRWKALRQIAEDGVEAKQNVPELIKAGVIPAIVIDVSDTQAKKLTIIMNETRGRADLADLGALLQEISVDLGDDLLTGLPYTDGQLKELMGMADFDWDQFGNGASDKEFDNADGDGFRVVALLNEEDEQRWKGYMAELRGDLPDEPKEQAGALIAHLMNKAGL